MEEEKKIDDGGQAFPHFGEFGSRESYVAGLPAMPQGGMTLRDYFAAAALQGMLCNGFIPSMAQTPDFNYAEAAYRIADAMIKERKHARTKTDTAQSQGTEGHHPA